METKNGNKNSKVFTIIGIVLCCILLPILIVNVTLIIKGFTSDSVPSFGNNIPMIVLTESMEDEIMAGDFIVVKTCEAKDVKEGDVISFIDPAMDGTKITTHRVTKVTVNDDGSIEWETKGDNNIIGDTLKVPEGNLVGRWEGFRIPFLGRLAIFMQTTPGLIICVFVPILLVIGYDVLRRRKNEQSNKQDTDALLAELQALRAEKEAKAKAEENIEEVKAEEEVKEE